MKKKRVVYHKEHNKYLRKRYPDEVQDFVRYSVRPGDEVIVTTHIDKRKVVLYHAKVIARRKMRKAGL